MRKELGRRMPKEEGNDKQQSEEAVTEIKAPNDPPEIELRETTAGAKPSKQGMFKTGIKRD